ncbi:unannotated protein [freshwater metagenome]|uniref:Unannotated protein n=1 Tax=freshwater metagenome TaxID=449393 RepID=A0A6J6WAL7_9ZZZZ|nr:FAD-dependent oxidoreductase [Actinomycetota bacterium]MSW23420.1 FAD-dependent oxidoreductase [Actinomycetota bacterium]MSW75557.1 FAD-dependent oxidoreductase [Actinomycetota bacterium]MSY30715.1 FAD-dependent oxidoreductase [Actinomycetota bacterium]
MSLWWTLVDRPTFSPGSLDQQWDVLIVGGGFSGLWSAHHLLNADPSLKIAILEASHVGSGASGRNGGWVSALYPRSDETLATHSSPSEIAQLHECLRNSIDAIGDFVKKEKIDCGFSKGGSLLIARHKAQLARLVSEIDAQTHLLSAEETKDRINMHGAIGATYTPHCARINPAQLVVALAQSLEQRGVAIFENTKAQIHADKSVEVGGEKLHATIVIRAIEAYRERTRELIPIYSLMIATEPLPQEVFDEIGIAGRETFAEANHVVSYAQRTPDNRLAIGGRGAPYTWGSKRNSASERHKKIHAQLRAMSTSWFPILKKYEFTHAWGGAVAITRDSSPYARFNGSYAELGGYIGDGVTLSFLVAQTLADLITNSESERTRLPFVQWQSPQWEIEPLRWLGVNSAIVLSNLADREERMSSRPSLLAKGLGRIMGT